MVPSSRKAWLFLFIVSFILYLLDVRTPFDSFPSCSGAWWLVTVSAFPSLRLSLDLTVSPGFALERATVRKPDGTRRYQGVVAHFLVLGQSRSNNFCNGI